MDFANTDKKIVVSGLVGLIGTSMPIAQNGALYVKIHELGGLTLLLYILPLVVITISILSLLNKLGNVALLNISVGIVGLLLTCLTVYCGILRIESFISMSGGFGNYRYADAGVGLGGWALIASYISVIGLAITVRVKKAE